MELGDSNLQLRIVRQLVESENKRSIKAQECDKKEMDLDFNALHGLSKKIIRTLIEHTATAQFHGLDPLVRLALAYLQDVPITVLHRLSLTEFTMARP